MNVPRKAASRKIVSRMKKQEHEKRLREDERRKAADRRHEEVLANLEEHGVLRRISRAEIAPGDRVMEFRGALYAMSREFDLTVSRKVASVIGGGSGGFDKEWVLTSMKRYADSTGKNISLAYADLNVAIHEALRTFGLSFIRFRDWSDHTIALVPVYEGLVEKIEMVERDHDLMESNPFGSTLVGRGGARKEARTIRRRARRWA